MRDVEKLRDVYVRYVVTADDVVMDAQSHYDVIDG